MKQSSRLGWVKAIGGVALLFALVFYRHDLLTATAFIGAGIIGWLNIFGILHALLSLMRRQRVTAATWAVCAGAMAGSLLLVYFGFGAPLALTTTSFLVIDALALRFHADPIGYRLRGG